MHPPTWVKMENFMASGGNCLQRSTYYVIASTRTAQKRQICSHGQQIGGCRGLGARGTGNDYLMGTEFPFGVMKRVGTQSRWWSHKTVKVPDLTE